MTDKKKPKNRKNPYTEDDEGLKELFKMAGLDRELDMSNADDVLKRTVIEEGIVNDLDALSIMEVAANSRPLGASITRARDVYNAVNKTLGDVLFDGDDAIGLLIALSMHTAIVARTIEKQGMRAEMIQVICAVASRLGADLSRSGEKHAVKFVDSVRFTEGNDRDPESDPELFELMSKLAALSVNSND